MNSYRSIPFRFIFGALCFCIIASCSLRKIPASNDPQNAPESPERFKGIDLSDEQYFPTPNEAIKEFDSSFRQNSTEDIKGKLREVVDANQITFIGQSSHMRFSPYQLLLEVLPTVKEPVFFRIVDA